MPKSKENIEVDKLILECDAAKMFFAEEEASSYVVSLKDVTEQVEAQQKLVHSEKRFKALVQEGADMTAIVDQHGVYQYVSPNYPEIVGYTEENLLGKNAFDFIHPEDVAQIKEEFVRLLSEKRVKSAIYRFRHKNGNWYFLQTTGSNLLNEETIQGIVINSTDITDLVHTRDALNRSNERFEMLMKAGSESIWDYDLLRNEFFMSDSYKENFGIESKALNQNFEIYKEHLHPYDQSRFLSSFYEVLEDPNQEKWTCTYRLVKTNGEIAHVEDHAVILRNNKGQAHRIIGTTKDITAEYYYHQFDLLEKEIMEYSMFKEVEIKDVLAFYMKKLEALFPDMKASVMLIKNNLLQNLASPSLPQEYIQTIEGFPIGNNVGSCGTSAYLKEKVIVTDVLNDERWKDFKSLAIKHNFNACWSFPIFNADGVVIATFANYYATPRIPNALEEHVIERSRRLISIFIEKFEYLTNIQKNNERYELINKASRDAIYEWDIVPDVFYWSESYYSVFGYPKEDKVFRIADWANLMHPCDNQELKEKWIAFLNDSGQNRWTKEFRFKKADGSYAHVEEIGHLIRDKFGKPLRMIGVLRDISSAKLNEKQKLLQHHVSQFFKTENSLNTTLSEVLELLTVQGELQTAEIWLTSIDDKHLNIVSTYAQTPKANLFFKESENINRLQKGEGMPGRIWKSGAVEIREDIDTNDLFARKQPAQKAGLKSAMGLPLFHKNKVVGVLLLCADTKTFFSTSFVAQYEPLQYYLGDEIKRKEQEEEMFLLFQSAPEIMTIVSPDRHFVKSNPAFCNLLGYTEEEIAAQPFDNFVHPNDLEKTISEFSGSIIQQKRVSNSLNRYRTKSGNYRWISWSSSDAFGDEKMVFAYGKDVTEIIELQGLLENASKSSRVGGWEVDVVNNVQYWSPMTKIIHEVPEDFQPDMTTSIRFYREDVREKVEAFVKEAVKTGTPFDFELPIITAKGNERWVRAIGNAEYLEGKCVRLYGSLQDIHHQKITELQLQKSFEERNNILESIGDAFFAVDKNWIVTYWNKEAEKVLHRKREAVMGKSLWESFPDAVGLKSYAEYSKAMETGTIAHFDEYYPTGNQWFEVSAYPSEEGLSVYFKDVSIRKIAEEEIRQTNERFEKVTEATNDAIWDWDILNNIYYRSEGYERLFGYKMEREIPSEVFWNRHFFEEDVSRLTESVAEVINDSKATHWKMEYRIKKTDGTSGYVIDRGVIIRNNEGKAIRMIGAMTDITYQKEHEESLKRLNAQLKKQTKELMVSNKELEQFAYVASHDLQEPLRMVTSFLNQLKRKYNDQLDEKAHQYIHFAVDGSLRMRQIILDILEFSRVGKHEDSKDTIDLNEIVEEVYQLQHRLIEDKKATVNFTNLPVVTYYRSPLVQVFQNLISNALKYAKPNVPVKIEVTAKELRNEWEIAIKDNGIGISKEYHEKIFILFQRLHVKDQYSGTGIGLAIVKKILDNLGGRIRVVSEEGEGSTFYFTIPK